MKANGMTKISQIEIYVSDYAKTIRFYDLILGFLGWRRLVCQTSHTTAVTMVQQLVSSTQMH